MIHPDFEAMAISIPRLLQVDFMSLRDPVPDYASHTSIMPTHVQLLTTCAVHYDLDFRLVTRYLGGEYTAEWRDVNKINYTCEPIVSPQVISQMEHILTTGCPLYFNWEEDAANKRTFVSWRNLPSVAQYGKISCENAHEGGLQQPPYPYGTVGLHMLTMGSTRPSEHPHQAREEAPPDVGWLDSHVLVRDLNEHGDANGNGD